MAFRHYEGAGLPGTEARKVAPPPSAPPPRRRAPAPAPIEVPAYDSTEGALDALEDQAHDASDAREVARQEIDTGPRANETKDHLIYVVQVTHLPTNAYGQAAGMTPQEALSAATQELERVMPVRALVWDDGSPVEGIFKQVLSEAIEQLSHRPDVVSDPTVQLAIGRLKGALGEE